MTHLNLDQQSDAVKQFFKSLVLSREGSLVEMNGQPLARMFPASLEECEWSEAQDQRRHELINRSIAGVITRNEGLELELLQDELQRFVERVAPLPLEYARQLHKELLEKVEASTNGTP